MERFDLSVSNYSKLLNSYQVDAVSRVLNMIKNGEDKIYVLGSQGTGKTSMSIFLSEVLYGNDKNKKILFIAYHKILNVRLSEYFSQTFSPEEVIDMKDNRVGMPGFYFTTWHQLRYSHKSNATIEFDYIIADEFHDYPNEGSFLFRQFNSTIITFGEADINNYNSIIPTFSIGSIFNDTYSEDEVAKLKIEVDYYRQQLQLLERQNKALLEQNKALQNEKESSTKQMLGLLEQLSTKIDQNYSNVNEKLDHEFSGVKKRLDNLTSIMESINDTLSNLQKQYEKSLINANREEERENLIHKFSEELLEVLLRKFQIIDQPNYKQEKDKLLRIFGPSSWDKLTDESRQYIITSNIIFNHMAGLESQVDYSAVCIPLTKALERELYIYFFYDLKADLRNREIPIHDWPHGLTYYSNQQKQYLESENNRFTLGSLTYILGNRIDYKRPKRDISTWAIIKPYFFRKLAINSENDLKVYLKSLDEGVRYVTVNFRNQAAHKDKIGLEQALSCYNYLIRVTGLLVELSKYLKV